MSINRIKFNLGFKLETTLEIEMTIETEVIPGTKISIIPIPKIEAIQNTIETNRET